MKRKVCAKTYPEKCQRKFWTRVAGRLYCRKHTPKVK